MAQIAWTVQPEGGRPWTIGLFHGDDTGHVMLYCNNVVTQLDFSVKEDRTYSLLLDEELCQVSITKQNDGSFAYDCKLDEAKMAARAAARKAEKELEAKHERQRIQLGVMFILFFLLLGWWLSR
jgi:hypothetical protein